MDHRFRTECLHKIDPCRHAGLICTRKADVLRADADGNLLAGLCGCRGTGKPEVLLLQQRHGDLVIFDGGNGAGQKVHAGSADESGDKAVGRRVVELEWRSDLLDPPLAQHHDAVGERHRLGLVVGDVDHRGAEPGVQRGKFGTHRYAQFRIEIGERLVEQEGGRIAHDGAPDRHALALAAGKLAGAAAEIISDFEHPRRVGDARVNLGARHPGVFETECEVLANAHVRVERIGLEHHRNAAVGGRNRVDQRPVDADLAAGRRVEARDLAQQRGLATPRGPDEDDELAVENVKIDAAQHVDRTERLGNLFERDPAHGDILT